jgi:predicted permease
MAGLGQDMRFARRSLARTPAFTATVISTLALGIGATTALFSIVNGVLLKPLPFLNADRLVTVWSQLPGIGLEKTGQASAMYFTYRDEAQVFEDIGIWRHEPAVPLAGLETPETVSVLQVSDGTLPILRVEPMLGRRFSASDDSYGAPLTIILGHRFWQSRFGGAQNVLGRTLMIDAVQAEIIGVMPPGFRSMWSEPDIVVPLQLDRSRAYVSGFRYPGIARLAPGVTIDDATAGLAGLIPRAIEVYGGYSMARARGQELAPLVSPLMDEWIGATGQMLWFLFAATGLVLVIACANVANLILVRAEGRQREIAVRAALGGHRWRIARGFLVEGIVLGLGGAIMGSALAWGAVEYIKATRPGSIPRIEEVSLDPTVLVFALFVTSIAVLVFGLVPLVQTGRTDLTQSLGHGGRTGLSRNTNRVRSSLAITQIAMALVLLISSGLMVRSFHALRNVHPGVGAPQSLLTMRIEVPGASNQDFTVAQSHERMVREIERIPGVTSVGLSTRLPMVGESYGQSTHVQGITGEYPPTRQYKFVSGEYFETMEIPILAGRGITWDDIHSLAAVAVVNERFASEYWDTPSEAIGQQISMLVGGPWRRIVGVSGNVRDDGLDREDPALVYWPFVMADFWGIDRYVMSSLSYAIRTTVSPRSIVPQVRAAVWSVNPTVPLADVRTQQDVLLQSTARTSFIMVLLGVAAGLSLMLGLVGLYSVIAYMVSQRAREIGIRLALGARAREVMGMVVRRGLVLALAGVIMGLAAAVAVTRVMRALLFEVEPVDVMTYGVMAGVLTFVAVLASFLPARRAATVDPVRVLQAE